MRTRDMNKMLCEIMEEMYLEDPELFPKSITSVEDEHTGPKSSCSDPFMRRLSNSQALRKGVSQTDISLVSQQMDEQRHHHRYFF